MHILPLSNFSLRVLSFSKVIKNKRMHTNREGEVTTLPYYILGTQQNTRPQKTMQCILIQHLPMFRMCMGREEGGKCPG